MTAASWATRRRAANAPPPSETAVAQWLPLVHWCLGRVWHSIPAHCQPSDGPSALLDAGTEGLVRALRGFDASRGVSFKTYAASRIRWHIMIGAGLTRMGWPAPPLALDDPERPVPVAAPPDTLESDLVVAEMLADVPARTADVLRWRAIDGESFATIGERLGVSRQRAEQIYQVGIQQLQRTVCEVA
jgi:DNA-directed RNA polymerase specialized sigma subunit